MTTDKPFVWKLGVTLLAAGLALSAMLFTVAFMEGTAGDEMWLELAIGSLAFPLTGLLLWSR